ncbi:hypothetical protein yrohd0001_34620 [Yersinia rohdei ATCC 43380]|nr:hypothetical protein yrohd0001_34620 [Yersinia rohdei ATCC 43380]
MSIIPKMYIKKVTNIGVFMVMQHLHSAYYRFNLSRYF